MTKVAEQSAKMTRWRPKHWDANYEQIVIMSALGKSHKDIATQFGYTAQHITNIVNCPEAMITRRRILDILRDQAKSTVDKRLSDIADKAVTRLHEVMHNDELFEKSPFAVVDRGLQILKGLGNLKVEDGAKNVNAIFIAPETSAIIRESLAAANEAKRLQAAKMEKVEVSATVVA